MNRKIAVVGLGYVGLPVAVAFGKQQSVIGFDINAQRIDELKAGYDRTKEVVSVDLKQADIYFTTDQNDLAAADFIIVSVPTPINRHKQPDLGPLHAASRSVGTVMRPGTIVVFESTVFPGATEEECGPILEACSGLVCGEDFFLGYSPERINPGDSEHTFERVIKVVSGQTPSVLETIAEVYGSVVQAGVYKAPSIKVAESAKVIENIQRDVNVALMNELALIFEKIGVDTRAVLEAAGTKWNFLKFSPGLVGGHCIGVDPYYLTHKAQELGYHPEMVLAGRRINDDMSKHIALSIVKAMLVKGLEVRGCRMNFLGLTFKENTPDLRNTKVIELIRELEGFGFNITSHDAEADKLEAKKLYGVDLIEKSELEQTDVLVFAVCHEDYRKDTATYLSHLSDEGIVVDIKGIVSEEDLRGRQSIWKL